MSQQITVTPLAVEKVKAQLESRGTPTGCLRLGVKGGGCSGFSYVIQFEDSEPRDRDLVFEFSGVRFLVDKKSILYLNGMTLDWEKNLMGYGFKFVNPNETSKCGCGLSFSI